MRKDNEIVLNSDIYARIRAMRLNEIDRRNAIAAMQRAEQVADIALWVKQKVSGIGHWFLKPSLKH